MTRYALRQVVIATLMTAAFVCQETWALAGTTGGLSGSVVDADTSRPVAGAQVSASSPSQTASAVTDASGRFTFLTLAPDTYTITVAKSGYQTTSDPGQIVFADSVQTLAVRLPKALQTIAHTVSTGAASLVKAGTTADVYSVNGSTQHAAQALGGGGSLNSAYSAIATVPGAYVIPNQTGYYQTVSIRGGDYDQVGYEFDGVPVNRSFDNYPSTSVSSLGNAEVQVYTGANPATSEGQGLSGFINQVIKTGTYPAYAQAHLGIGAPSFYHQASVEIGGATPDRNVSYYFGAGGYNQEFRYVDNSNGASYDSWIGAPINTLLPPGGTCVGNAAASSYAACYAMNGYAPPSTSSAEAFGLEGYGPGGLQLGAFNYGLLASVAERDVVANLHVGIPHRFDGGKDDVQVLWDSSALFNGYYSSTNDIASPSCTQGGLSCTSRPNWYAFNFGPPIFLDGYQSTCQAGKAYTAAAARACVSPYYFPNSTNRTASFPATGSNLIPLGQRDGTNNNQEIVKIQYTKNFGSNAFFRLYGYTYYSDWLNNAPNCAYANYVCGASPDYELSSHTRGVSALFQDQIDPANLLTLQGDYTTASTIRDNNSQWANFGGPRARGFVAVDANDPYDGLCYNVGASSSAATSCNPNTGFRVATFGTWGQAYSGALPDVSGARCGTGRCEMLAVENGLWATYNSVVPRFAAASVTDIYRPNDRWLINAGVRVDSFTYLGSNTDYGPARQFWFNAYNRDECVNASTGVPADKVVELGIPVTSPCPSGYRPANLQNVSGQNFTFNEWQPRLSGTYTMSSNDVLRFSFGRYTQAPNAAFEQYNTLQEDLPFTLLGSNLYPYGRNTPGYPILPPTSLNYDASWEHHFRGSDVSFKLTPFLRQTQNQIQLFFLNQKTAFISGLNTGSQRSQGVEFQMQKGDFSRDGISALLSLAYTNSYVRYGTLPNGTTVITPLDTAIGTYNAYTKACAPGGRFDGKTQFGQPLCARPSNGRPAARCYKPDGTPDAACGAGDIRNPYWDMPGQSLIDPGQNFPTYSIFPGGIGSSASAFGAPYVATLLLNYRHAKVAVTPSLQFEGGTRYGYPVSTPGVDPAAGCSPLPGTRRYDATTCLSTIAIPNTYTGQFDGLGSFVQPNNLVLNLQLSYDLSPRVSLTGVLANIVNTCWGGTAAAWTVTDHNVCSYVAPGAGSGILYPVGNVSNPNSTIQGAVKYPYVPYFGPYNQNTASVKTPFNFYLSGNIRI